MNLENLLNLVRLMCKCCLKLIDFVEFCWLNWWFLMNFFVENLGKFFERDWKFFFRFFHYWNLREILMCLRVFLCKMEMKNLLICCFLVCKKLIVVCFLLCVMIISLWNIILEDVFFLGRFFLLKMNLKFFEKKGFFLVLFLRWN